MISVFKELKASLDAAPEGADSHKNKELSTCGRNPDVIEYTAGVQRPLSPHVGVRGRSRTVILTVNGMGVQMREQCMQRSSEVQSRPGSGISRPFLGRW